MIVAMPCIVFILSIFALQTLSTVSTHTYTNTIIHSSITSLHITLLHHQRAGTVPGSAPADHLSATIGVVQCADSPDPECGFLI